MVTATELLRDLRAQGVAFEVTGDKLSAVDPHRVITSDLAHDIGEHKPELLALLAIEDLSQTLACEDCRPSHTRATACEGRPFVVGAPMKTAPGDFRVSIHCPVCCPSREAGR